MGRTYLLIMSVIASSITCSVKFLSEISGSQAYQYRANFCILFAIYNLKRKQIPVYPSDNKLAIKTCTFLTILGPISTLSFFIAVPFVAVAQMEVFLRSSSIWLPVLALIIIGQKLSLKSLILCPLSFLG